MRSSDGRFHINSFDRSADFFCEFPEVSEGLLMNPETIATGRAERPATFSRIGAVVILKVEDHYPSEKRFFSDLEKRDTKCYSHDN
jgi:hypothetical protein